MRKVLTFFPRTRRLYNAELSLNTFKSKIDELTREQGAANALAYLKSFPKFSSQREIMEKEADLHLSLRNFDHSLELYGQILEEKDQLSNEALCILSVKMAECYIQMGEHKTAIKLLEKAKLYNPESTLPLHVLADLHFSIGKSATIEYEQRVNFEKAIQYLDDAIKINFEEYHSSYSFLVLRLT